MKKYEAPAMICRTFEAEDIIITSGVAGVKNRMIYDGVDINNIKVVAWDNMQIVF